jgi:hypothetical protein
LLLLDADVVIDLHNLSLFEKMSEQNPATLQSLLDFFGEKPNIQCFAGGVDFDDLPVLNSR